MKIVKTITLSSTGLFTTVLSTESLINKTIDRFKLKHSTIQSFIQWYIHLVLTDACLI